jgi:hypothetical protein
MPRAIELSGRVRLTIDDRTIDVVADGTHLQAEIGDLDVRRPTLRLVRSGFQLARRLARTLDERKLTLDVTSGGRRVVSLGAGVRGPRFGRLFGLERVRMYRRG